MEHRPNPVVKKAVSLALSGSCLCAHVATWLLVTAEHRQGLLVFAWRLLPRYILSLQLLVCKICLSFLHKRVLWGKRKCMLWGVRLGNFCQDYPQSFFFFWEDVKLKRALVLLRLSIISVKKLPSMPSKNILGTTKISSSSCLFLLLCVLVYRHFREAPCCADSLGKARGFSAQWCPVGTSLLRWTCLRWARFSPVLLIMRTVSSRQLLLAHLLHHFLTWLLIVLLHACWS